MITFEVEVMFHDEESDQWISLYGETSKVTINKSQAQTFHTFFCHEMFQIIIFIVQNGPANMFTCSLHKTSGNSNTTAWREIKSLAEKPFDSKPRVLLLLE